jgi:hypothetical protein
MGARERSGAALPPRPGPVIIGNTIYATKTRILPGRDRSAVKRLAPQ